MHAHDYVQHGALAHGAHLQRDRPKLLHLVHFQGPKLNMALLLHSDYKLFLPLQSVRLQAQCYRQGRKVQDLLHGRLSDGASRV